MLFGTLENAELTAKMPNLVFEHPRARHSGYVAIKKALTAAFESDFCTHVEAVCGGEPAIKESIPKINVCMWEKKGAGAIEMPAIVYGYPRYVRELDSSIKLDDLIRAHIKHYNEEGGFIISFDNNLYIKETPEPYEDDVLALALAYYIAHLRGKRDAMKAHLKDKIAPIFNKVLYVPTKRAEYDPDTCLSERVQKQITNNGAGVDINQLNNTLRRLNDDEISHQNALTEIHTRRANIQHDIDLLLANPNDCPAAHVISECLKQLKEITTKIDIRDNEIVLTLESFLDDFDERDWARQWDDPNSYLNNNILNPRRNDYYGTLGGTAEQRAFIKKLYKRLFIDKDLKLVVAGEFCIQLFPLTYSWYTNGSHRAVTGYSNPHLFYYNCWHEANSAIQTCFRNKQYEVIPLYIKSVLSQITLKGDAAGNRLPADLLRALMTNNPTRAFVDKEGYAYTIKELFDLQ